jgi:hypothetical protein
MPLRDQAQPAVEDWVALNDAEARWLDWALAEIGLASEAELLRVESGSTSGP